MSALDPVDVWVDLFDITEHPPTDSELEEFGQAFERAVRAAVAADIRALADEMRRTVDPLGADPDQLSYINCTYIDASMVESLAARIAEGKQP